MVSKRRSKKENQINILDVVLEEENSGQKSKENNNIMHTANNN